MSIAVWLAVTGFLSLTIFFPLLGAAVWKAGAARRRRVRDSPSVPTQIAILMPVHNEEKEIGGTLLSILRAVKEARRLLPGLDCRIAVGADGCSDFSAAIANSLGVRVLDVPSRRGKWSMLQRLVLSNQDRDYLILVDAGVRWQSSFLSRLLMRAACPTVMAVAPAYRRPGATFTERCLWKLEGLLKGVENWAGGPVSVHGATVAYRRAELVSALSLLGDGPWLNDDVAIPAAMRLTCPEKRILYAPDLPVDDRGGLASCVSVRPERRRRHRMSRGNLQWIGRLLPELFRYNLAAGLLALRRVSRLFWGYWIMPVLLTAGAASQSWSWSLIVFGALVALFSVRALSAPLLASLMAPFHLLEGDLNKEIAWS